MLYLHIILCLLFTSTLAATLPSGKSAYCSGLPGGCCKKWNICLNADDCCGGMDCLPPSDGSPINFCVDPKDKRDLDKGIQNP